jgi:archaellum component FlaC
MEAQELNELKKLYVELKDEIHEQQLTTQKIASSVEQTKTAIETINSTLIELKNISSGLMTIQSTIGAMNERDISQDKRISKLEEQENKLEKTIHENIKLKKQVEQNTQEINELKESRKNILRSIWTLVSTILGSAIVVAIELYIR